MKRVVAVLALLAAGSALADARTASASPQAEPAPKRVLYLTHSATYFHQILPYSVEIMKRWAARDGKYAVDCTDDCAVIAPDSLAKYDCLVFYTNRELPVTEPNRQALLDFVRQGKGFVAIHSGTGTFFQWLPYQTMINSIFDGHPWSQKVRIRIEDLNHPIMKGVPPSVEINDEIYQHTNWERSRTHVLASLDVASVDLNAKGVKRQDKDFGIAWAHRYGKGRVYVNVLGHTKDVWDAPWFETMIVQGIHWSMGELPLDLPDNAETGK